MAGFVAWRVSPDVMARHALVSLPALREGRVHTLITSAFSQARPNSSSESDEMCNDAIPIITSLAQA